MSQQVQKAELRRMLLKQRRTASRISSRSLPKSIWKEKSDRIVSHLQSFPRFIEAKTILAYFSFRQEPDLSPLFRSEKQWGFPRIEGKSLIWHCWKLGDKLETNKYGILEPSIESKIIESQAVDLILIPTVACDRLGYRLGYGGGYYDRMLSSTQWSSHTTIGIVFDFAYLPQLPVDAWDKKLDFICTEEGIFNRRLRLRSVER